MSADTQLRTKLLSYLVSLGRIVTKPRCGTKEMCRVWESCGVKPTVVVALVPLSAGSSFELSGMTYKATKKPQTKPFFPLIGKAVPKRCMCLHQSRTFGGDEI